MGFFRIVNGDEMDQEKLKEIWEFSMEEKAIFDQEVIVSPNDELWDLSIEEKISDGQKVIVSPNNIMLYIQDNKVIDVVAEPGGYIYHSGVEPDPATAEYRALFNEYLTKHNGSFGENDLVFLYPEKKITSLEQVRSLLSELAAK